MAEGRRRISKKTFELYGVPCGSISAYSDGSATAKLKRDNQLVDALYDRLRDILSEKGFIVDPENTYIFHYQLDLNEEENADGEHQADDD